MYESNSLLDNINKLKTLTSEKHRLASYDGYFRRIKLKTISMLFNYIAHIRATGEFQTCTEHCRNTAEMASKLMESIGLSSAAYLAGLMHDAGKFTPEFNNYITKAVNVSADSGKVIHSFAGPYYLLKTYHKSHDEIGYREITAEIISAAIASHHGLMDCIEDSGNNGFEKRKTKQPEYEEKALAEFRRLCAGEAEIDDLFKRSFAEIQSKLELLQNVVNPNPDCNDDICFLSGLLVRLLTSALIAADRTDTADFMADDVHHEISADEDLWKACLNSLYKMIKSGDSANDIQQARCAFSDECEAFAAKPSGIYCLDLPTGGGKTLSGLRYALKHAILYDKQRIFYVAPLLSVIEQNADVIRHAVGRSDIVLEHHSNVINQDEENSAQPYYELLQESWHSPIIVTTLVRMLETMFSAKTSAVRRFSALSDSIIIFDEIQSLPKNMISLFNMAVNFLTICCNATVVLCSATQPGFSATEHPMLAAKKIVSDDTLARFSTVFKRTEIVDVGTLSMDDIVRLAEKTLNSCKSLLVVCNTKSESVRLFNSISSNNIRKYYISAGMCPEHRRQVLSGLLPALVGNEKVLCVSTQVIEAGIDISFEKVIRLSAGIDSIVQTAGRCNRHGEYGGIKPVYVARVSDEKLGPLKDIADAQNAMNDLFVDFSNAPDRYKRDLQSPTAIDYYFRRLYSGMKLNAMDYPVKGKPTLFSMLSFNELYRDKCKSSAQYFLAQSFKMAGKTFTVFDEDTKSVLVPYKEGAELAAELENERAGHDISYTYGILKKAKKFTVSIFSNVYNDMLKDGIIHEVCDGNIAVLNYGYYDDSIGIINSKQAKEASPRCDTLIL